ncbi:MAG: class I SAM-dependent methyltransferase [Ruminococcus sp.]
MSEARENPAFPEGKTGEKMLERMNKSHAPLRAFALPLLPWRPAMRILDVGCGGGATIAEMLERSPESVIDGIDYSEVSVRQSEEMNRKYLGTRCSVCQADAADLPFPENTYDLVTAMETVYFWPDADRAFAEILRVLKPSGIFAVINEGSDPEKCDWPPVDGFMKIYLPEELTALMTKAGFRETKVYHGQGQIICVVGVK